MGRFEGDYKFGSPGWINAVIETANEFNGHVTDAARKEYIMQLVDTASYQQVLRSAQTEEEKEFVAGVREEALKRIAQIESSKKAKVTTTTATTPEPTPDPS